MRKFILCGEHFTKEIAQAAGFTPLHTLKDKVVSIIPNAAVGIEKQEIIDGKIKEFGEFGMKVSVVDLEKLSKEEIIQQLNESDIVCITGGLISNLAKHINAKKVRDGLKKIISEKDYIGISAGSMIMSDSQYLAINYPSESDPLAHHTDGFGFFHAEFFPHSHLQTDDVISNLAPDNVSIYKIPNEAAVIFEQDETNPKLVGGAEKLR